MKGCSKKSSSPVLRPLEGKAAASLARGTYMGVREHDKGARTPLRAFSTHPLLVVSD